MEWPSKEEDFRQRPKSSISLQFFRFSKHTRKAGCALAFIPGVRVSHPFRFTKGLKMGFMPYPLPTRAKATDGGLAGAENHLCSRSWIIIVYLTRPCFPS